MIRLLKKLLNLYGLKLIKIRNDNNYFDIVKKLIKNKPLIFDVGANKGQGIHEFIKIYPDCTIHAFEPNKKNYELEKAKSKYRSKNLIINYFGLAEKKKKLNLNITKGHSGWASVNKIKNNSRWIKSKLNILRIKEENFVTKQKITCNSIDNYCRNNNINKIDILKIDTQGSENAILKGAQNMLRKEKIKIIIVEIIFSKIYENSLNIFDLEKILIPNKYKLISVSEGGNIINNLLFQQDLIYASDSIYKKLIP